MLLLKTQWFEPNNVIQQTYLSETILCHPEMKYILFLCKAIFLNVL